MVDLNDLLNDNMHFFYIEYLLCRIEEANSVLHQVVFEKAKLQLKHAKKERLLVLFVFVLAHAAYI